MVTDSLKQRLTAFEDRLSPREARIASVLRRDFLEAGRSTIGMVAARAGVEKSAVSRFARKLGYARYSDLKEAAWRVGKTAIKGAAAPSSSLVSAFSASLNRASDAFEAVDHAMLEDGMTRAATMVAKSSRIVLCGVGAGRLMTRTCGIGLERLQKPTKLLEKLPGTGSEWHRAGDLPLLVCVPTRKYPEETWTSDLLRFSDAFGPVILLTTSTASLKGCDQDVVLRVSGSPGMCSTAMAMLAFCEVFADRCQT